MKRIVILTLYPQGIAPGPRFRYEQYLDFLEEKFEVQLFSFFDQQTYRKLHSSLSTKSAIRLGWVFLKRYAISLTRLFNCAQADYVFIYRDVNPFGPPFMEWIIAKLLRKKIIYDFDDAIWLNDVNTSNKFKVWLRNVGKTNDIIAWSYKISCGNDYLCQHAKQYNAQVIRNPTTIDTITLHNELKDQYTDKVVIGWTGTHSTLKYLDPLIPVIARLEKDLDFTFLVICNKNPSYDLKSYSYRAWCKETEKEDLLEMNIGLMPLSDDEWSRGKCGFKALQYMALGMPALVSPVGVNAEIVTDGENGFICLSLEDWEKRIYEVVQNAALRQKLGLKARETVEKNYSVLSNKSNFLSLFN